jgi:hypothetical protein
MDTLSIHDIGDESVESSEFLRLNNEPNLVSNQNQINNSLDASRNLSRCDDNNVHLISTNDILNHDYNQMKLEEGRMHRMNLKKERSNSIKNSENENDLFITHVTLNLDVLDNRPTSASTWKYNAIKKNNSFVNNNANKTKNSHLERQR